MLPGERSWEILKGKICKFLSIPGMSLAFDKFRHLLPSWIPSESASQHSLQVHWTLTSSIICLMFPLFGIVHILTPYILVSSLVPGYKPFLIQTGPCCCWLWVCLCSLVLVEYSFFGLFTSLFLSLHLSSTWWPSFRLWPWSLSYSAPWFPYLPPISNSPSR